MYYTYEVTIKYSVTGVWREVRYTMNASSKGQAGDLGLSLFQSEVVYYEEYEIHVRNVELSSDEYKGIRFTDIPTIRELNGLLQGKTRSEFLNLYQELSGYDWREVLGEITFWFRFHNLWLQAVWNDNVSGINLNCILSLRSGRYSIIDYERGEYRLGGLYFGSVG